MLHPGLYEQVINNALTGDLAEIPEARKSVAPIDKAEASKVLAQYLADVVQKGLDNVLDNGGDISAQIGLTNQIVDLIQSTTKEADFAALGVDRRAEQLLALLRETDPRLAVGKTAADIERPETSIAQSSLFTGAVHEPQMFTELKKEIVSADRIDMLVSFIKWSGLRLIMDELREFTQNGGELRIITTSYMGATDVKAIEELRKLPNTHIKVSYNTKTTRLHAKAYIFYRETGFTTAYVGSSNLSNAALTSGLEWNTKVTKRDLPETIDKIAATFEYYWNDREFEYYDEGQKERLARALKAEKYFDTNNKMFGYLMEKEVKAVDKILNDIKRPFTAIMGGSKVSSKIEIIENLLNKVDNLIITGGMTYTFTKAMGGQIGLSICEDDKLDLARELMQKAKDKGVNLVLAVDAKIADAFSNDANTKFCPVNEIPDGWEGLDIGPKSEEIFAEVIKNSKTILWNGPTGVFEFENFTHGSRSVGEAIVEATKNGAFSLVGGGDSVACVNKFGLANGVSYVSTGGGALLEAIEGKVLPGIAAIQE